MEASSKPPLIAILMHQSLLSMGIASRLQEQAGSINIQIIDAESETSAIQGILRAQLPELIILDTGDVGIGQKISVMKLLEWAPTAKVICLDNSSERVRVYCSKELTVSCTSELMSLMQTSPQID